MKHLLTSLVVVFLLSYFPTQDVAAFSSDIEIRAKNLSTQILCPSCQGQAIDSSRSTSAELMINELRDLLEKGYSDDEIRQRFVSKYGEGVLLQPRMIWINFILWCLPLFFLLGLIIIIIMKFRFSPQSNSVTLEKKP